MLEIYWVRNCALFLMPTHFLSFLRNCPILEKTNSSRDLVVRNYTFLVFNPLKSTLSLRAPLFTLLSRKINWRLVKCLFSVLWWNGPRPVIFLQIILTYILRDILWFIIWIKYFVIGFVKIYCLLEITYVIFYYFHLL